MVMTNKDYGNNKSMNRSVNFAMVANHLLGNKDKWNACDAKSKLVLTIYQGQA